MIPPQAGAESTSEDRAARARSADVESSTNMADNLFCGVNKERLDYSVLEASLQSFKSGSLTPIIKEELKWKIQSSRLAAGKMELPTPVFREPQKCQLTPEEEERRRQRRERNRIAALKCRNKRKQNNSNLQMVKEELLELNKRLREEVADLERQKDLFMEHLTARHVPNDANSNLDHNQINDANSNLDHNQIKQETATCSTDLIHNSFRSLSSIQLVSIEKAILNPVASHFDLCALSPEDSVSDHSANNQTDADCVCAESLWKDYAMYSPKRSRQTFTAEHVAHRFSKSNDAAGKSDCTQRSPSDDFAIKVDSDTKHSDFTTLEDCRMFLPVPAEEEAMVPGSFDASVSGTSSPSLYPDY